jgi:hypothetical protein
MKKTVVALGVGVSLAIGMSQALAATITAANIPSITISTPGFGPLNQPAQFTIGYADLPPAGDTASLTLFTDFEGASIFSAPIALSGLSGSVSLSHLYSFVSNYNATFKIAAQFLNAGLPDGPPITAQTSVTYHVTPAVVAATPIPAALPLFVSALGGLGFLGWRHRKTSVA